MPTPQTRARSLSGQMRQSATWYIRSARAHQVCSCSAAHPLESTLPSVSPVSLSSPQLYPFLELIREPESPDGIVSAGVKQTNPSHRCLRAFYLAADAIRYWQ